ncbi:MAG: hypothetical protein ACREV5_04925 [Steroidobacter sp.]
MTILSFVWSAACAAQQEAPSALKVVNLGTQTIVAFSITGMPFRDVGLDAQPGDALTPAFGDGQMTYEMYWRLQDGRVHGAAIDLREELPKEFHGDVLITTHDDHVQVAWFNVDPSWVLYSRVGDPNEVPMPNAPYYIGCEGSALSHPLAVAAWTESAKEARERSASDQIERRLQRGRCTLDWYVPRPLPGRQRMRVDEDQARALRQHWRADIEEYRSRTPELPKPQ